MISYPLSVTVPSSTSNLLLKADTCSLVNLSFRKNTMKHLQRHIMRMRNCFNMFQSNTNISSQLYILYISNLHNYKYLVSLFTQHIYIFKQYGMLKKNIYDILCLLLDPISPSIHPSVLHLSIYLSIYISTYLLLSWQSATCHNEQNTRYIKYLQL